ncbi:hypothetical protein BGX29_001622 [Mortierella sp. GBA35]|nr:hypothetical protein BGX29_001622 [Mortierella sp. GBA35]
MAYNRNADLKYSETKEVIREYEKFVSAEGGDNDRQEHAASTLCPRIEREFRAYQDHWKAWCTWKKTCGRDTVTSEKLSQYETEPTAKAHHDRVNPHFSISIEPLLVKSREGRQLRPTATSTLRRYITAVRRLGKNQLASNREEDEEEQEEEEEEEQEEEDEGEDDEDDEEVEGMFINQDDDNDSFTDSMDDHNCHSTISPEPPQSPKENATQDQNIDNKHLGVPGTIGYQPGHEDQYPGPSSATAVGFVANTASQDKINNIEEPDRLPQENQVVRDSVVTLEQNKIDESDRLRQENEGFEDKVASQYKRLQQLQQENQGLQGKVVSLEQKRNEAYERAMAAMETVEFMDGKMMLIERSMQTGSGRG